MCGALGMNLSMFMPKVMPDRHSSNLLHATSALEANVL